MSSSAMARLSPKSLPIHLLARVGSDDINCDAEDVTYVSTNPAVVTCAACLAGEPEATAPPLVALGVTTPDQLRAWRAQRKLSQRALAALLDVSFMTVFRWEKGTSPIPRTTSLALAYLGQHLP